MKKTHAERQQFAYSYHETTIHEVVTLLSILSDDFFSRDPDFMSNDERIRLKDNLLYSHKTISTVLNIAINILGSMDADLDAASDVDSAAARNRKAMLCIVYGLTEDAAPAGEHSDR